MKQSYKVKLTEGQRQELLELVRNGKEKAKKITHARILLQADCSKSGSGLKAKQIAENLDIHERTVHRVRQKFGTEGLAAAINRKAHKNYKPRKLDGEQEAKLIALCCSQSPEGRKGWTLKLLGENLVSLQIVDNISRSTVYRTLKKTNLSRG